jgi:hypothetical protein
VAAATGVTTGTLPTAKVGIPYRAHLSASGGGAPYTWSNDQSTVLPPGLKLNTDGAVTGTPSAAGTSTIHPAVTDSFKPTPHTADRTVTITVTP